MTFGWEQELPVELILQHEYRARSARRIESLEDFKTR